MARLNLPSPARTVRKGIKVCRYMGLGDETGYETLVTVAAAAMRIAEVDGTIDLTWLAAVQEEAQCQLARLRQRTR